MSEALDPAAYVYEGFWVNWTKGRTNGLTLTLCPASANLLIATLALFVTMSGGQLWTIVRFTLHQIYASRSQSTSMAHNQQLVVLRNATTDLATARLSFYLAWLWRKDSGNPVSSCMIIVLIAISHAVLFMFAGAFSATLASAGQSVLSRSPYCGIFNQTYLEIASNSINVATNEAFKLSLEFIAKKEQDVQLSLGYARDCYMSQAPYSSCDTFQQPRLNWTTMHSSRCPFEPGICHDSSGLLTFDTGLIDSHKDLGINGDSNDGISYRRVTSCTVLNDTGHVTGWVNGTNTPGAQPWMDIAFAYYGQSIQYDGLPWTYAYSNFANFYTNFTGQTTTSYQVFPQLAYGESPNPSQSTFVPLAALKQKDADVTLLFLSFTGRYIAPVDDPWFSAHQLHLANSPAIIARETYIRDRPVSTLGCTEQHQVCTSNGKCSPLLGFDQVQNFISSNIPLTVRQNVTLDRILRAVTASSMREVVESLAVSSTPMLAITATASESSTLSLWLPPYQWQVEANYWHSVAMAQFQRIFVEYGTGQIAAQTDYLLPPQTDAERWICENLMIRGTTYQSFSVLALALIVGVGTLVILLSLNIENLASWIRTRMKKSWAGRESWDDYDMLGLQQWRKAFESQPQSRNSSRTVVQKCHQNHSQKWQQPPSQNSSRTAVQTCYQDQTHRSNRIDYNILQPSPAPTPDPTRLLHAVSAASYREGFMAGGQGAWF